VSEKIWLAQRKKLLKKEKTFNHHRDEISQLRRELPWVKVEKPYALHGPNGKETLADLFGGRSQLLIKHFMFRPWLEGRLRGLLVRGGPHRRRAGASAKPRCDLCCGFAGAATGN
jgi:predicted dithiol-disulfide oxidoreductase (DUF899 family)